MITIEPLKSRRTDDKFQTKESDKWQKIIFFMAHKPMNADIDIRQIARVFDEQVFVDGNLSTGIPLAYCSHTLGILYPYSTHTV